MNDQNINNTQTTFDILNNNNNNQELFDDFSLINDLLQSFNDDEFLVNDDELINNMNDSLSSSSSTCSPHPHQIWVYNLCFF